MLQLLDLVIFCTLLALIPLTAIPYGTVEEWWESLLESIIFALAALWIVEGLLRGTWLVDEHRLILPLLVLLLLVIVQTIPFGRTEVQGIEVWRMISADSYETRLVAFRLLTLILATGLLLRYTSSRKRLHALVFVVIGVGVMSAVFGMARQITQHETGFLLPHLQPSAGYGQFINRNHFAFLMEMTLGLVLGLVVGRSIRRNRGLFIYLATAAVVGAALVLSNSRGGILALFGQALFLILIFGHLRCAREPLDQSSAVSEWLRRMGRSFVVRAVLGTCLMIGIAYGVVWMGGDPLVQHLETLPTEVSAQDNDSKGRRLNIWRATWKLIKANPIAGTGFGGYWIAIDGYYDASGTTIPQQAHNDYLELLASGGIIAGALAAWFVVMFIKRARECLRSRSSFRRAACLGALGGLFAVAIHSIVDFGLHVTVNALVFTVLIVVATVNLRVGEQMSQSREVHQRILVWPSSFESSLARRRISATIRSAVAVIGVIACFLGIWTAESAGLSRLHSQDAEKTKLLTLANQAVDLSPSDPAAHRVRAGVLLQRKQLLEAIPELERAVALRSGDHFYWRSLGLARNWNGDPQGALAAFRESVRLAPFYAAPRWQLGTFLLRTGQRDQAFAELRRAAQSDPALWPSVVDLAWDTYGDVQRVERAIQPETDKARLALAGFLIKQDDASDAIRLFRASEKVSEAERQEILAGLITAKRFTEAYQVWSGKDDVSGAIGLIQNPGFETKLVSDPNGFGWQFAPATQTVGLSQVYAASDSSTSTEVRAGTYSLRVDFNGASGPVTDLVSQAVLVEPNARYQLQFSWRSQELISLGMPQIIVSDAADGHPLAKSEVFTRDNDWRDATIALTTAGSTKAVQIILGRQSADPIFGRLWLDDFRLKRI